MLKKRYSNAFRTRLLMKRCKKNITCLSMSGYQKKVMPDCSSGTNLNGNQQECWTTMKSKNVTCKSVDYMRLRKSNPWLKPMLPVVDLLPILLSDGKETSAIKAG